MNDGCQQAECDARPSSALAMGLSLFAGLTRLVWHPYNMTAMNALGLFGGARLPARVALALPLAVMLATDLFLRAVWGWRPFDPFVYGSLAVAVLIGRFLKRTSCPLEIGAASLLCTAQFFLITNFGMWLEGSRDPDKVPPGAAFVYDYETPYPVPMIRYARTPEGLAACYLQGLAFDRKSRETAAPLGFFGNLLVGDLFFSGLLFGAHALLARRLQRPALAPVAAPPN